MNYIIGNKRYTRFDRSSITIVDYNFNNESLDQGSRKITTHLNESFRAFLNRLAASIENGEEPSIYINGLSVSRQQLLGYRFINLKIASRLRKVLKHEKVVF